MTKRLIEEGIPDGFRQHMSYVEALMQTASDGPLEDLENAIMVARLDRMASRLIASGFAVRHNATVSGVLVQWNLLLVHDPAGAQLPEWATLEECRRLLDTVANLPPAEAFARWRSKIEPLPVQEYTRQDAIRDTRMAREALRRRAAETNMSTQDYALEYKGTSFMDLVPKKQG